VMTSRAYEILGTLESRVDRLAPEPVAIALVLTAPPSRWVIDLGAAPGKRVVESQRKLDTTVTMTEADLADLADGLTTLDGLRKRDHDPIELTGDATALEKVAAHFRG
jgi:hypothetical protein